MKVNVGIDLGSTTCKAVVMNSLGEVIGHGITNTRSNYPMATKIATHVALTNARFSQLGQGGIMSPEELRRYELLYHRADYLNKHKALQERMLLFASERGHDDWIEALETLGSRVDEVLLQEQTLEEIADQSRFFKDLIYSYYMTESNEFLPVGSLDSEGLLGLLDKALVVIENEIFPLEPEAVLPDILPEDRKGILDVMKLEALEVGVQVGTGYGRNLLPFPEEQIRSEILCHARGAYHMFPNTKTVLDIGGQDTKAIQLDDQGIVRSFFMNDRCAAGCGRYLGYVADELAIGLGELGPTACEAECHLPISSTCTVFAGAELRDLLYAGEKPEEILLGLHRAIVLRAMSLLARSGGIHDQMTFTGGVAKNEAVRQVLRELVSQKYGDININIHPDSIYTGALGAALYAKEQS